MDTRLIKINRDNIDWRLAGCAGEVLRSGGVVAFPTETVYGLGANAYDADAVRKVFAAKGRPSDNPLIVHVADAKAVEPLVREIPESARLIIQRFWPGPISIILKKSDRIPDIISAGLDTVALRMPSHPVAAAVIRAAGVPVAAPSANLSGKPSPTNAAHVMADLLGKVDMIVDGGACEVGVESTVLDLTGETPTILRPGGITAQMLTPVLGAVISPARAVPKAETPKCPGMKYQHYAPDAAVFVVEPQQGLPLEFGLNLQLKLLCANACKEGKKVGVLACGEIGKGCGADICLDGGSTSWSYGTRLFALLREFDRLGADVIYAPMPFTDGLDIAVKNRLYKAAGGKVARISDSGSLRKALD